MKVVDISVEYVDHMGSDLSVVNAARVSFDKESDWIYKNVEEVDLDSRTVWEYEVSVGLKPEDEKLINYLAAHGHWTPFAHTALSLRVKAPIFVARQMVKHQVGLVWNEVSRRYVDSEPEFYIPKVLHFRPEASIKQGSGEIHSHSDLMVKYLVGTVENALSDYEELLKGGIAPEEARMVLPLNTMTEWIWTGNCASWARVCNLRLDSHAQLASQEVAKRIHSELVKYFPISAKALVHETSS